MWFCLQHEPLHKTWAIVRWWNTSTNLSTPQSFSNHRALFSHHLSALGFIVFHKVAFTGVNIFEKVELDFWSQQNSVSKKRNRIFIYLTNVSVSRWFYFVQLLDEIENKFNKNFFLVCNGKCAVHPRIRLNHADSLNSPGRCLGDIHRRSEVEPRQPIVVYLAKRIRSARNFENQVCSTLRKEGKHVAFLSCCIWCDRLA